MADDDASSDDDRAPRRAHRKRERDDTASKESDASPAQQQPAASDGGGDSEASSSSSSSDEESRRAKKRRKKKEAKQERRKKDAKKSSKKKKKDKKKKAKKSKKAASTKEAGAVDQTQFGKYGILRESDYFAKRNEFEAWCHEVKRVDPTPLTKRDLMDLFGDFREDYNTATMPSERYYDLDKWDREHAAERERRFKPSGAVDDDEAALSRERAARRREEERRAQLEDMRRVAADRSKLDDLRERELLQSERSLAYKRGDTEKVRQIDRKLNPAEQPQPSYNDS